MPIISLEQLQSLLLPIYQWAREQEAYILAQGKELTMAQKKDARQAGVYAPEKVRLLRVPTVPLPDNPTLLTAAQATELISPDTIGLSIRYGIFIRDDYWNHRCLLVHELAHTAQYEQLGGLQPFLKRYLEECLTFGYPLAPLEQEAIQVEKRICSPNLND